MLGSILLVSLRQSKIENRKSKIGECDGSGGKQRPALVFFARAKLLPYERNYGPGCLNRLFALLLGIRLKWYGRRSESIRIAGWNIVLIQDSGGSHMARELPIDFGALLRQLRHRADEHGTPPLADEKALKDFLARLLGHEARVGVVPSLLVSFGNLEVVLGLPQGWAS